jgi:hypothetical protein
MPEALAPLAEQSRSLRWWLSAARRNPLLGVLIVTPLVVTTVVWTAWQPTLWLKSLITLGVLGPLQYGLGALRERGTRSLERADEAAERTGRRRPFAAPDPQDHPATFTWRSPMGRRLAVTALGFAVLAILGLWMLNFMITDQPPDTASAYAFYAGFAVLAGIFLPGLGVMLVGGMLRSIHRALADPVDRVRMDVLGIDPATRTWVLQRQDDETRTTVKFLAGQRLLVAGDEVLAQGPITAPPPNWRRMTPVLFAVTGEFGTLWALHSPDPT